MMNEYFSQTVIPTPILNWKSLWPEILSSDDPGVSLPLFRLINTKSVTLHNLWSEGNIADKLKNAGIEPYFIRIFRWPPNRFFPWHIDGVASKPRFCALNWVLEGHGEIQWNAKFEWDETTNKTNAFKNRPGKYDDIYEESTNANACLVNTLIPHRIVNMNNAHRITLSILVNEKLNYAEVYNRLASVELIQTLSKQYLHIRSTEYKYVDE
jgi:hypothetical protein